MRARAARYRSAITGRFVTAKYAMRHPKTCVCERPRRKKASTRRTIGR